MNAIMDRLQALGFRLFLDASAALNVERASRIGGWLGRFIGPRIARHQKVLRNLEIAFPGRDAAWHQNIALGIWEQFGRGLVEYAHLPELCRDDANSRIDFVDLAGTAALRDEGRPIVYVAVHLGNWNLPAVVGQETGIPLSVLYRKRKNKALEVVIDRWRSQMPCGFIDVDNRAPKLMLDELRKGNSIGLFIDRRGRSNDSIPFFGVETPTPTVAARLAIKTGAAFIPVHTERLPGVRFRITLHPQIHPDPELTEDRDIACEMTERVNLLFADWIQDHPDQWIATTKRWPRGTTVPVV